MRNFIQYLRNRTSGSDWLVIAGIALAYLLLRGMTFALGLPPMEWVALGGLLVIYGVVRSVTTPYVLLILVTIGSLLGNLILVVEDGLIPFSLFQIFYIFSLLVFVLRWFMTGLGTIQKTGFELELVLFFGLIFLTILWTPDAERAFLHAMRVVVLSGLLYLFVNWITEPRQITILVISMIGIGSILGLMAVYHTINNPMAIIQDIVTGGTRLANRARIGQIDPNVFASLFFLPLAYTASISFSKTNILYRLSGSIFFVILFSAVLITFSRSAWVSVLVMVIVLAVMYRQYNLFLFAFGIIVLLITLVPDLRHLLLNIVNRFLGIFFGSVDASNQIRIILAETSFKIFFDSWLMGVGWRGFPDAFLNYYTLQETLGVYEPHNVIYLVYTELGLAGLLLFIFIVYKIFYLAYENIQLSSGVEQKALSHATFGAFLAYAIFYQFLGSGFLDNQLWITTGIIIALNIFLKRRKDVDEGIIQNDDKPQLQSRN